jgi:hypothetical protein
LNTHQFSQLNAPLDSLHFDWWRWSEVITQHEVSKRSDSRHHLRTNTQKKGERTSFTFNRRRQSWRWFNVSLINPQTKLYMCVHPSRDGLSQMINAKINKDEESWHKAAEKHMRKSNKWSSNWKVFFLVSFSYFSRFLFVRFFSCDLSDKRRKKTSPTDSNTTQNWWSANTELSRNSEKSRNSKNTAVK